MGSGQFLLDWDKAATLPEHGKEVGTAIVTYSRLSATDDTTIDASFNNVKDEDSGQLVDAEYRYMERVGDGGTFDFQLNKNFVAGAAIEALTVRSRWQQTGTGRSDVKAQGGDLAAPATVSRASGTRTSCPSSPTPPSTRTWAGAPGPAAPSTPRSTRLCKM